MKTTLQKIDDRRKLTDLCYKHEDGSVFLLDYLNDTFSDIGYDEKDITNLSIINELFQEYFDTGGKEAGEFVYAAENLLKFINIHYDFLKAQYIYKEEHNLFRGGFYWFLITEYQQYIGITSPEPLRYNTNILSDAIKKYEEIQNKKLESVKMLKELKKNKLKK